MVMKDNWIMKHSTARQVLKKFKIYLMKTYENIEFSGVYFI